jgi:hypothetical protein
MAGLGQKYARGYWSRLVCLLSTSVYRFVDNQRHQFCKRTEYVKATRKKMYGWWYIFPVYPDKSMTFPLNTWLPKIFPNAHPAYAPVTIVIGHFCHSRSLIHHFQLQ